MDTSKLHEALAQLRSQQQTLAEAISGIERVLSLLGPQVEPKQVEASPVPLSAPVRNLSERNGMSPRSYVDDSVDILAERGHALHVRDIVEVVSNMRGKDIPRASFESTIIRHIKDSKSPRLVRVGPSTFDIPRPA